MEIVGRVESLWRYPVKSMKGEELSQAFAGFAGIYGDRCYAFLNSGAMKGFPYLTARERQTLLLYSPAYRHGAAMSEPPNLEEAEALGPGVTPLYADDSQIALAVTTPDGAILSIDDPRLIGLLRGDLRDDHQLSLRRSDRAMTDCRPISLFSRQTAEQLGREAGVELDLRRFRANIYLNLENQPGFAEDQWVGRTLRIGEQAVIAIVDRDPRCKMITLDPETGEANPEIIRVLARAHETRAGIYAAVIVEGTIRTGDTITAHGIVGPH